VPHPGSASTWPCPFAPLLAAQHDVRGADAAAVQTLRAAPDRQHLQAGVGQGLGRQAAKERLGEFHWKPALNAFAVISKAARSPTTRSNADVIYTERLTLPRWHAGHRRWIAST